MPAVYILGGVRLTTSNVTWLPMGRGVRVATAKDPAWVKTTGLPEGVAVPVTVPVRMVPGAGVLRLVGVGAMTPTAGEG